MLQRRTKRTRSTRRKAKFRIEPLSYKFAGSLADTSKELTQQIDHILEEISTAYKKRKIMGKTES